MMQIIHFVVGGFFKFFDLITASVQVCLGICSITIEEVITDDLCIVVINRHMLLALKCGIFLTVCSAFIRFFTKDFKFNSVNITM
ncbi:MAG: hypothetical protein FKGGLIKP_00241 [Sodalis sp. Fse]|nr:MAG: hypothetical protein CMIDDMOC_00443 [Sodalis sp. Fle]UVK77641.1 MAG: hypothetical protein FKGGLIKP_00241 [Sodalis sp. Fse]